MNGANFNKLKGKEMRVMFQQPRFRFTTNPKGNLFVKNLPDSMTSKELMDKFSAYGNILSCKVSYNKVTGEPLHYGYVHFSDPSIAQKVLADMNKDAVDKEGDVYVMEYEKHSTDNTADWKTCYVANFPREMTEAQLQDLFAPYGQINSVHIGPKRYNPDKIQGFVTFANHEDAVKAVEGLKDHQIPVEGAEPMLMYVNRLQTREERARINQSQLLENKRKEVERTKGRFLYVGFGNESISRERLKEIFQQYGTVESCSITRDRQTGEPKPFGFVCMDTPENAQAAIRGIRSSPDNRLKVDFAQTREERAKLLKEKRNQNPNMFMSLPMMGYQMAMPSMGGMNPRMPRKGQQMGMMTMIPMNNNIMPFPRPSVPTMPTMPMNSMMNQSYLPQQNFQNEKFFKLKAMMESLPPITAEMIQPMNEEERRNTFGERIFYYINALGDPRCSKITGMMLELSIDDLLKIVSDPTELMKKIEEANEVLDHPNN